jgi:hypothetical protein
MSSYDWRADPECPPLPPLGEGDFGYSIPPHQNFGNHNVMRPDFKNWLQPKAEVLGREVIDVGQPMNLVKVTFCGVAAHVLVSDAELRLHWPKHTRSRINLLAKEQRCLGQGLGHAGVYRHLITVACHSDYGYFITPPQWELFQHRDYLSHDSIIPVLFSAVVLVEWDDGKMTWEFAVDTWSSKRYWVGDYLTDLGKKNEKASSMLIRLHYLEAYGHQQHIAYLPRSEAENRVVKGLIKD